MKTADKNVEIGIPDVDPTFVPFGNYEDIEKIIDRNKFYTCLNVGETGVGKTFMIEQACAKFKRELFRINITIETDEDSLMGGIRLENGDTVFEEGPVVSAMRRGAVLLLDEVDLGSPTRIMCLQSVLEGKGYFVKRIGEWIRPAKGFMIFATANTKGIGDENGSYVGTQILNEAFMDRFAITLTQLHPPVAVETEILKRKFGTFNDAELSKKDSDYIDLLVKFADAVRDARKKATDGSITHSISTRRICQIAETYDIFGHMDTAVARCMNRYDEYHAQAFMDIWNSIKPVDEAEYEAIKKKRREENPFKDVEAF